MKSVLIARLLSQQITEMQKPQHQTITKTRLTANHWQPLGQDPTTHLQANTHQPKHTMKSILLHLNNNRSCTM